MATPEINPEAYYAIAARQPFRWRGIAFGTVERTELRGALLSELLDAPEAADILDYQPI